ncbi:helix-turn-helix transcriptional regulator [Uliginosibacterium sp. H3]|uniref:Helix-turn-helix transcriptional regulator n=1 Tax=Uliginosibacterium silvisoli TaxID=3114758 RepID=A0ABU6K8A7_9RHOO|nr:helix-turn-helix transcriptional regulator [Uliginosibacterium sp. H3]
MQIVPILHVVFLRVMAHYEHNIGQDDMPLILNGIQLTARESDIARLVARGKSNSDIAQLLNLSESTVKKHVSKVLDKAGCASRAGIAVTVENMMRPAHGTKVL